MSSVVKKIDSFLEKKMLVECAGRLKEDYASFIPIKKLTECAWGKEKHLRKVAAECFSTLSEADDELANTFIDKIAKAVAEIGEEVLSMYMVNNDIDNLPSKSETGETEEDECKEAGEGEPEPEEEIKDETEE